MSPKDAVSQSHHQVQNDFCPIPNTMFTFISYSSRLEKTTIERHTRNLNKKPINGEFCQKLGKNLKMYIDITIFFRKNVTKCLGSNCHCQIKRLLQIRMSIKVYECVNIA